MITNHWQPDAALPRLPASRTWLYRPGSPEDWTYCHHPSVAWWRGHYYAIWSNGRRDEDAPGQRVLLSRSADGVVWSPPEPLFDTAAGAMAEAVYTAGGLYAQADQLVAYAGRYEYDASGLEADGSRKHADIGHTGARTDARITRDGAHWSVPQTVLDRFVPNHPPAPTASGRLLWPGSCMHPWTDAPAGLTGWQHTGWYPAHMAATVEDDSAGIHRVNRALELPVPLVCEGSWWQCQDGSLTMLQRSGADHLWVSRSPDDGRTWSHPVPTAFTDNRTKFHIGRLPDGRLYYVGSPDPEPAWSRPRLILSISADDGQTWGRHHVLADDATPYTAVATGLHKGGDYGYPHSLIHGDHLTVICSRHKEAIELLRVPLAAVLAAP